MPGRVRALFEEAWRRARRRRALVAAVSLAAIGVVALALDLGQPSGPSPTAAGGPVRLDGAPVQAPAPLVQNGILATVGAPTAGGASDIYLLDPGGATPRQLTSTPGLDEYAPSWSPDGTLLAFIRSDQPTPPPPGHGYAAACVHVCDLVVMDSVSGATVLTLDIAHTRPGPGPYQRFVFSMVPGSVAWAPNGQVLVVDLGWCGIGGCDGSTRSIIVDLRTSRPIETPPGMHVLGWSPDGSWLTLAEERGGSGPLVMAVPTDHLDETSLSDLATRDGTVVLAEASSEADGAVWLPDSSAILLNDGVSVASWPGEEWRPATIDVVTVPEGHRRTIIADGAQPIVSPDGRHFAYLTGYGVNWDGDEPRILTHLWVADIDGTHVQRIARRAVADSWSPDGQLLVARDDRSWFTIAADGTGRTDLALRATGGGLPWGPTASWQRVAITN